MYGGQLAETGRSATCCTTRGTRTRSAWSGPRRTSTTSASRCVPIPGRAAEPDHAAGRAAGSHPRCSFAEEDCQVRGRRARAAGRPATACLHYERTTSRSKPTGRDRDRLERVARRRSRRGAARRPLRAEDAVRCYFPSGSALCRQAFGTSSGPACGRRRRPGPRRGEAMAWSASRARASRRSPARARPACARRQRPRSRFDGQELPARAVAGRPARGSRWSSRTRTPR